MKPMSNDELTKHAIRTSADMLEINEKLDDISRVQAEHSERFDRLEGRVDQIEGRLDRVEDRLEAHIAMSEDHFRRTDANFLEIRDLLGTLVARGE